MPRLRSCLVAAVAALATVSLTPGPTSAAVTTGTIGGTITAPGAQDTHVTLWRQDDDGWHRTRNVWLEPDGDTSSYSFAVVPGTYAVQVAAYTEDGQLAPEYWDDAYTLADATPIESDGDAVTADFELDAGRSISGTVVDGDGTPVEDAFIGVTNTENAMDELEGYTDEDGRFTVSGLAPGTSYDVYAEPMDDELQTEYWQDAATYVDADPVAISSTDVTGIDFELGPASHVRGTVTAPVGTDVTDATVAAFDDEGDVVDQTWVEDDGTYSIDGLPAGTYTIGFNMDGDEPFVAEWYQDVSETRGRAAATEVTVEAGGTVSGIDETIASGSRLTGLVLDDQGRPADATVVAYDDERVLTSRSDRTDGAGRFSIPGLDRADYLVKVVPDDVDEDDEESPPDAWFPGGVTSEERAQQVSITAPTRDLGTVLVGDVKTLTATRAPKVVGTARPGATLVADPGAWTPAGAVLTTTWLRDGRPVGRTGSTYTLTAADAGRRVGIAVTAKRLGSRDGAATSAAVPVAKIASRTTVSATGRKRAATVSIVVATPGVAAPGGTLTVTDGARLVTRRALPAGGRLTLSLSGLMPGKHVYRATYSGGATVTGSTGQATATVRKK